VVDAARVLTDEDAATVTRDLHLEGVVAKRLDAPVFAGAARRRRLNAHAQLPDDLRQL
jgi:hypothetical protein